MLTSLNDQGRFAMRSRRVSWYRIGGWLGVAMILLVGLSGCDWSNKKPPMAPVTSGPREMEFVSIEPGSFMMYSPELGTAHKVIFREGFELGKYVVTQGQWERVMGTRPWSGQGLRGHVQANVNHPAVYVSWFDVQEFIGKLNLLEVGQAVYRLPTEAEWEYACRAGTTTRWSFGDEERLLGAHGWYRANAWRAGLRYAQPVGQKLPNPWGLYDMHGNVWEWVEDFWRDLRIYRGGGFSDLAQNTGSAFRNGGPPDLRLYDIGVRLVRVKEETSAAPAVGYSP